MEDTPYLSVRGIPVHREFVRGAFLPSGKDEVRIFFKLGIPPNRQVFFRVYSPKDEPTKEEVKKKVEETIEEEQDLYNQSMNYVAIIDKNVGLVSD